MLSLFRFHLFFLDPKKTISFLNWWLVVKDALFSKGLPFYLLQENDHVQLNPIGQTPSQPQPFSHSAFVSTKKKKSSSTEITINPLLALQSGITLYLHLLDSPFLVVIWLTFPL